MEDKPWSVIDANHNVIVQCASEERAKDRLWEIENEGTIWNIKPTLPLHLTNQLNWNDSHEKK